MNNRLRLNFALETAEERLKFLDSYLPTLKFAPNEHELETLSDYILWGKNDKGLNSQQEGNITLKEWAPSQNIESLEGLMEIPGFQETKLKELNSTHYKTKRIVFDRKAALQSATPYFKKLYEDLFREIDKTELILNYYEELTKKRDKPPRESLLNRFTEEEQEKLRERASKLTPKNYLKMRHYLVELRTEQYSYRDASAVPIMPRGQLTDAAEPLRIGTDIEVRPVGLFDSSLLSKKIFAETLIPQSFSEIELQKVSDILNTAPKSKLVLDFSIPGHLLEIYKNIEILQEAAEQDPDELSSSAASIVRTLRFYESRAKLNEIQKDVLKLKVNGMSNMRIADIINKKYNTSYNDNYISTIYRQKVLIAISKAALLHKRVIENVFFPENFKVCKDCGRPLLRDPEIFTRQKKANDGFAPRCKICEKKRRAK